MALSFKEKNQIRKQIGTKLGELDGGDLSFKEKNRIRKEVGELLAKLEAKIDQGADNQQLQDLIAGKFNKESPERFLGILKNIVDEIKDIEPVKEPTIAYIEANRKAGQLDKNVGKKAKVLRDDVGKRWKAGDIGTIVENDYPEKYDYKVDFGSVDVPPDTAAGTLLEGITTVARQYYFFANEIEVIG